MKKSKTKRILRTYLIILAIASIGYLARELSGKFSHEFNVILFFLSLILISSTWEFMKFINGKLDQVFPFERSIPQRIILQLGIGVAFALTVRFGIYKFGEP